MVVPAADARPGDGPCPGMRRARTGGHADDSDRDFKETRSPADCQPASGFRRKVFAPTRLPAPCPARLRGGDAL